MGIPGLLPLLAPIARPVTLDRYRGLAAAVDAMAWLHRGIYAGDVRALAHAQHAAWYRAEEEAEARAAAAARGGRDGGGGGGNGDDGRYPQRNEYDGRPGDAAAAAAADAEEEEEDVGPSRRIDFDRVAEPAVAPVVAPSRAAAAAAAAVHVQAPSSSSPSAAAQEATEAVLSYALRQCHALLTTHHLASVLLVIDGDSLPSKATTNAARSNDRRHCYRRAREAERRGESSRATVRKLYAQSCGITHEMRRGLVERVRGEQRRGDNNGDTCNGDGGGTLDCLVAPYEADAQMAQLAHAGLVDVVLAEDSDLLAYGCPRVVFKVDVQGGRGQEVQLLRDLASMGGGSSGGGGAAGSGSGGRGGRGGGGGGNRTSSSSSSSQPSFQNWTHDMFVYMCILSGCDYCAGVPGVGIRTAHKLVRVYRTPARIFKALRAAGRMPQPRLRPRPVGGGEVEGHAGVARRRDARDGTVAGTSSSRPNTANAISFEESFWTAYRTFRHQTVYNPATGRAEPLLPIVEVASTAAPDWDAVGPMMDDEMARGIATGRIHPAQRIPWEAVLAATRATAARTRLGEDLLLATAIDTADQPLAPRSRHQLPSGTAKCNSPNSTGRARRALANSKDLFRFFARKPKGTGSSGTSDDSPRASPSSRSGRNRPPLREIFVNANDVDVDVDHNGLKNGNVQRSVAASITNQREKSARAGGGGHQPIPIHFGDYSTALVGTAFQPLSRQNNRADTSATGGLASRNISRAVQCLKANAAKARVIKYRGRRSPRGSKGNAMERVGSERHEDGDMSSFCPVPEASSQSVQSAPEDLLVRVHQNNNESVHDQVYGRSSLDANCNYECNHFPGGEDASQYHSRTALGRGFVDETAFEGDEILPYSETGQCYNTYSKQKVCGEYDQPFLEYDWSGGVEYQDGVDCGVAQREGTARVEQEELPVAPKYQYHSTDKEALGYDGQDEQREKLQREVFEEDLQGENNMGRRESSIDAPICSNYQQLEQDQYDHFHDKELLPSNNLQVDVDGEYWQHLGSSEGVKVPGSDNIDVNPYHGTSEYPPLDLSISSPQLKRQNLNATPNFRNSGDCAVQNQYDQGGKFDHQFPLEKNSGGGVDDEGLQDISAEQFYHGIIDYGTDFLGEGNYCFD